MNTLFLQKESSRFKVKVGVFLLLFQEREVLLLRRFNTGIADGKYVVPMGGLQEGERASVALIREAYEESGIILKEENIFLCHTMHRKHHLQCGFFTQMDLFFRATSYEGKIENKEPHKCDELKFYPLDCLPEATEPFIIQAIECHIKNQPYSECGWL